MSDEKRPGLEAMLGADPEALVGKRIVAADHDPKDYDRVHKITLTFDDGTTAEFSYWASWADDSSLELEMTREAKRPAHPEDAETGGPTVTLDRIRERANDALVVHRGECRVCHGPLEGAPGPECDESGCPERFG